MVQNKGIIFKQVPTGWPVPGQDLTVEDRGFDIDQTPPEGGVTVRNHYASFDPYQRGRMRAPETKSYSPPFELGKPITNRTIMKVIKSNSPKFQPGDVIISALPTPIEEYSVLSQPYTDKAWKLENPYNLDPKIFLGALGMPGLTAYSSFYDIGQPKKGETIFISAASGAVGQIVGQLAKHEGLKVIGSVGDDKKLDFIVNELKFDAGFNYKKEKPADALARLAPNGIDIYYENVGGEQLEAALDAITNHGRIIACGMISQYNVVPADRYPIKNLMHVVAKRLTMRGFIVGDDNMGPRYAKDHQEKLQKWIADGEFKTKMSITEGIDAGVDGFLGMLKGENFGKAVLEIAKLE
ncbi:NADP-dependent leukotriene B4 12-hydroxydehydrogenase [Aaosphaeria arxii CBS 175.79]|uniref:NADP-dependent leukotriene B4 12-hydroxydehydrogenase n=1 Tax=Aaosphaeria arxii CBS 175.79 TaxID=1450172 RepID=A0A6A5XX23_9PLEO|nr:NADP-dependent leukotriene B4 12-hydroxydehydrogenase [Aaosphaeria arxii CBS 175.79]KAF2017712.1 NADP-dependent leukotriene B4 12-hydroxydehydrogenase [Aaosphaeria arxii CBS 175.79]